MVPFLLFSQTLSVVSVPLCGRWPAAHNVSLSSRRRARERLCPSGLKKSSPGTCQVSLPVFFFFSGWVSSWGWISCRLLLNARAPVALLVKSIWPAFRRPRSNLTIYLSSLSHSSPLRSHQYFVVAYSSVLCSDMPPLRDYQRSQVCPSPSA